MSRDSEEESIVAAGEWALVVSCIGFGVGAVVSNTGV